MDSMKIKRRRLSAEEIFLRACGMAIALIGLGAVYFALQFYMLPPAFIATPGDSLVAHVTSSKDPVMRTRIAIRAAQLMKRPVIVTESCMTQTHYVARDCSPHEVPYKLALQLAQYTDTVRIDVPLAPGDVVDARHHRFIPADDGVDDVSPVRVYTTPAHRGAN